MNKEDGTPYPMIRPVGLDGVVVTFAGALSESANRAALAFRAELERGAPPGTCETASSLVSAYLRFDPLAVSLDEILEDLRARLAGRDWGAAPLPAGRRLWHVPAAFGGAAGPQLREAAELAGRSAADAIGDLTTARLRVEAIGFAPGLPYMGQLPAHWNIPRQAGLTPRVPAGAIVVAIRQVILFPVSAPTGWRQVGQAALRPFRPEAEEPFAFRPGDEVQLVSVPQEKIDRLAGGDGLGGATWEPLS